MNQMQPAPLVVHEAERQRQHVRLRVPLIVEIAGQRYNVQDWSVAGFSLPASALSLPEGHSYNARLVLAFAEFEFDLKVRFEVVYVSDATGRIGCRLVDQTPQQLSVLQFMVDAYLSGEIVQVGDLFDIARRDNFIAVKQVPKLTDRERWWQRARGWLFGTAVAAVSLGLLALIAGSAYERMYVIDAHSAVVTTDLIHIAAPQGGRLAYGAAVGAGTVEAGQPLATVTTPGGSVFYVDSPCDCSVVDVLSSDDSQVGVDASLLLLAPEGAQTRISALIPYDDAMRLREGEPAALTFAAVDGSYGGHIAKVDLRRQLTELGQPLMDAEAVVTAEVTIVPDQPVPVDWIGKPVGVRIDVFGDSWLGKLTGGGA
ncbi:MAG: PilZ domain-containing protein [Alphaproteobacteria bacterium]